MKSGHSPLVIAHRGASAVAPEGTAAAIREAVRSGAQMIELDVRMTRDGRLVIFHDGRLERTTAGLGWIHRTPYVRLARLDAGSWFHPRFAAERVLLVSQALRLIPARLMVNLELKQTVRSHVMLERLLSLLRQPRVRKRLLISSIDPKLLRPLAPRGLALSLISRADPDRSLQLAIRLGCVAWHPYERVVTPARIVRAHAAGMRVHAWTVDNPSRARRLLALGVDGLFTNDPARLRRALKPVTARRRRPETERKPSGHDA